MVLIEGMTIWILALLLLAAGAGMGLRQGAIRVAVSFVGIILSALLAWPLSGLVRPLLPHIGFHNPIVIWLLPPFLVFIILLSVFKSFGLLRITKRTFITNTRRTTSSGFCGTPEQAARPRPWFAERSGLFSPHFIRHLRFQLLDGAVDNE